MNNADSTVSSPTVIIYHPIYLKHNTGVHHPERPSRLLTILRKLHNTGLMERLKSIKPNKASVEDIMLVHERSYIRAVEEICRKNDYFNLDADTVVSKDSYEAALFAAGGVLRAVELVFNRKFVNAFCMIRPPGHHARPSRAMGFCIFNNIAIGARYLQKKYHLKRILIMDWDVHHGNGTEEVFYEEREVFYISLHQYPHYPGSGGSNDIGKGKGEGFNLNIPMKPGSGDEEYIKAFQEKIIPAIDKYKPEFILISAGFDGHRDDPLSSINLTEKGYEVMTKMLMRAASRYCLNRLVSVLEGGYNLLTLASSVQSHLSSLYSVTS